jgi:hypothetical protein
MASARQASAGTFAIARSFSHAPQSSLVSANGFSQTSFSLEHAKSQHLRSTCSLLRANHLAQCALQRADHEVNQSKSALAAGATPALTDADADGLAQEPASASTAAGSASAADEFVDKLTAAASVPKGMAKGKAKGKAMPKGKPKAKAAAHAALPSSPPSPKPKAKAKAKVGYFLHSGKWYELGCSKCRWSMKGCGMCRSPHYNGRRGHK